MAGRHHSKRGDPARIAREAELLTAARHPGVVELVGIEGDPLDPVLVTQRVEGRDLANAGTLSRAEAAGITAALASTLADVHQQGIVHGAVTPEHVIIGPGGRPVLCGFGHGGRAGALDPAVDVRGLGALLKVLLAEAGRPSSDPLLRVAEDATAPDAAQRPTAARFAAAINEIVPDACLPGASVAANAGALEALRRAHAAPSWRGYKKRRKRQAALVAAAGILLVSAGALAFNDLSGAGGGAAAPIREPLLPSAEPTTPTTSTTSTTLAPVVVSTSLAAPSCPRVDGTLAADTDGDGCPEALTFSGGVLEAGAARWSVGAEGDQVASGDWACRGRAGLALLHPPTGDVFLFDGWAGPGHDLVGGRALRVEGGFALRSGGSGNGGCPQLLVDRRDGPPVAVPTGRGA